MERDHARTWKMIHKIYFNSHAHVERDPETAETGKAEINFNSHAHVERDMCQNGTDKII